MRSRRTKIIAIVVAGGLLVSVGAAVAANAGGNDSATEKQAVIDDAAKSLGVAPDKLESALEDALVKRVDAAVAAGRLTKEQGAEITKRIRAGEFPLGGFGHREKRGHHGGGMKGHHGRGLRVTMDAAIAYLGITRPELHAAHEAGTSLAELAKTKSKDVAGLKAAMLAALTKHADDAVTAGTLTAARRDQLIAKAPTMLDAVINGTRGPGGFGRGHDDGPTGAGGTGPDHPTAGGGIVF
jgi:hypothetical protein